MVLYMSGWLFFGFLKHQQYLQANPRVFLNDRMNHFQVFFKLRYVVVALRRRRVLGMMLCRVFGLKQVYDIEDGL